MHVHDIGPGASDDIFIWEYARSNGFFAALNIKICGMSGKTIEISKAKQVIKMHELGVSKKEITRRYKVDL